MQVMLESKITDLGNDRGNRADEERPTVVLVLDKKAGTVGIDMAHFHGWMWDKGRVG